MINGGAAAGYIHAEYYGRDWGHPENAWRAAAAAATALRKRRYSTRITSRIDLREGAVYTLVASTIPGALWLRPERWFEVIERVLPAPKEVSYGV